MEEDKRTSLPETLVQKPAPATDAASQKKAKKLMLKVIGISILILIAFGAFRFASFYMTSGRAVQQIYLIPKDAIFIIQSNNPVEDWKQFSRSEPWNCLKQAPSFADITRKVESLDSILHENKKLLSFVGKRDLMISAHKVRTGVWDVLYVLDLQKISEVESLKEMVEQVYSLMNFKVTYRKCQDIDIVELKDVKTGEILYTAFVDNHYIASYSSRLVEASINERNNPSIGLHPLFIEADKLVTNKGLYRLYIQYACLPQLLEMYMGKDNEYIPAISQSMVYAGLYFQAGKEKFELNGYTFLNDTIDPFVSAFLHSGKKEMNAHRILSDRTAFYTNIGFDDPVVFVKELGKARKPNKPAIFNSYKKNYKKIESLFDISLPDDFLSWMSGEFAISEMEPGLLGHENEMILAIRAKEMKVAKEKMAFIEKKVKKRTPLNVKVLTYKDYTIHYVELKGFFALFFGKMFDKFEKPYYTYIEDYVVFSNSPASILSLIEDYEQGHLLKNNNGFKLVEAQVNKKSTYFVYVNTHKFFPMLKPLLNEKTWTDLYAHKEIAWSFPYSGFQIIDNQQYIAMQLTLNYAPYQEEIVSEEVEQEDDEPDNDDLSELKRFYAEKFQGNVYREFYPEGALKSECEIRKGKRHGKYHEYYDNGSLKIRGKYVKGEPQGTWKYYTETGTIEKKVRMLRSL
jgi:hypothetical protein